MTATNVKENGNQERACLQLTRFLYPKDEVELSLMTALLTKEPCETCLFWACELIYSGFDISQLLWSIYYDFYAQLNPGLFDKIATALKKLKEESLVEPVLVVIKTLRVKKATDNVFSLRISQVPTSISIYKGRAPAWLTKYPSEQRPLLRAICNYDWNQIIMYIGRKVGEPKELIKSVLNVMMEKNMIERKEIVGGGKENVGGENGRENDKQGKADDATPMIEDIVEAVWDNHGYEDEFHIVLSLIVSLITPDEQIVYDKKLIKLNDAEKNYVSMLNGYDVSGSQGGCMRLLWKRLCKTTDYANAFVVVRGQLQDKGIDVHDGNAFSKEITDNWPYHCSQTPYWQSVFRRFGVVATCASRPGYGCDVNFVEVEGLMREEAFWMTYGFLCELDEPFTKQMWELTCPVLEMDDGSMNVKKDVVDVMNEIFSGDRNNVVEEITMTGIIDADNDYDNDLRMDFENIALSNKPMRYSRDSKEVFDFSALEKLLETL